MSMSTLAALLCLALLSGSASAAGTISSGQALRYLNAQRAANGIPAGVTNNSAWDTGCADHIAWEEENPTSANPHQEIPGTPGYTAAGAAAGQSSVLAIGGDWAASSAYPWGEANPWEMSPIHLMQLLSPDLSASGWGDDGRDICMITWAGYDRPPPAVPKLMTYPGAGTSFIYPSEIASEWPFTPGDFVGLRGGMATGPNLFVFGYGTGRGAITSASLTGPGGPVEIKTVDDTTTGPAGDLGAYLPAGGIIIPVTPLTPGAVYTANVTFAPNIFDWNDIAYGPGPTAPVSLRWDFQVASATPTLNATFDEAGLRATSNVPSPVGVLIARLPSDTVVGEYLLHPGAKSLAFDLPGAHYEACFVQAASVADAMPRVRCKYATWRTTPTITLGKAQRSAGHVLVPLTVMPTLAGVTAKLTLAVPTASCAPGCPGRTRRFYDRSLKLAAHQTLRLPDRAIELLTLGTPRTRNGEYLFSARTVSKLFTRPPTAKPSQRATIGP
ncbi:MAG TPA: hypothetical protein VG388_11915 [Solirubrobacteraceae bacterium]|jgi:hypothetical protein|nr:hypothetical protein [Solirubrobacteraceae bacterium]